MGHVLSRNGPAELEAGTDAAALEAALTARGQKVQVKALNSGLHAIAISARAPRQRRRSAARGSGHGANEEGAERWMDRHRIDRRRRRRAERLAGPAVRAGGHAGRAGGAQRRQAGRTGGRDSGRHDRLRRRRAGPGRARCSTRWTSLGRAAGHRGLQCQRPVRAARWSSSIRPEWRDAAAVGAFGGFLVAQAGGAADAAAGTGAILFTGASASVKGYKLSAPFAMGKFALRGLAQSIARELAPQGIHVAPFRDRRCDPQSAAGAEPIGGCPCSTPTRSRAPTCTSFARTAAPGPGRSSCGPGSRTSSGGASARSPRRQPMPPGRSAQASPRCFGRPG